MSVRIILQTILLMDISLTYLVNIVIIIIIISSNKEALGI